jgi:hypothetical protein
MGSIDIGAGAANYDGDADPINKTQLDRTNPANDSGEITSIDIQLYYASLTGVKVGTFYYVSGTNYQMRDYETLGSVNAGSRQPFTGLHCTVSTGDFLACSCTGGGGSLEKNTNGGSGHLYYSGNAFDASAHSFATETAYGKLALYGTGTTLGWSVVKFMGIASASIVKCIGIAVASVKKVMGVAVQ